MGQLLSFDDIKLHVGHKLAAVTYGDKNAAIECETCSEVVVDHTAGEPPLGERLQTAYGLLQGFAGKHTEGMNGKIPWVHNAAVTNQIEPLRAIAIAHSDHWNNHVLPFLQGES